LIGAVEELKAESNTNFKDYVSVNELLFTKLKEATDTVAEKIH